MRIHVFTILLFLGSAGLLCAQQNTTAAGSNATGTGGSVSYSVGQLDYISANGSGGNLNQGVQQPYQVGTTNVGQAAAGVQLLVYPNPSADEIMLDISSAAEARAELHDVQRKLIWKKQLSDTKTIIDMAACANGVYFLSVFKKENLAKEFKIVKQAK